MPALTLYDLSSSTKSPFSPTVWRIRLLLNYHAVPYTTTFLEFPDIAPTLSALGLPPNESGVAYTVPGIHDAESGTVLMGSAEIARWICERRSGVPLNVPGQGRLEELATQLSAELTMFLIPPREPDILNPRSREYFLAHTPHRTGRALTRLSAAEEDALWAAAEPVLREFCAIVDATSGPFILGDQVSYVDFRFVGFLECVRVVDEGVWERFVQWGAFRGMYEGCRGWMGKVD